MLFSSLDCKCQELIKANILMKIVISLREVKSQGSKNPCYCFYWSKISPSTCDWSDAHFSLVKKNLQPIRICAVYYKSIFFSNLAWSKSQGVYYKPTYIHMHFKNFGPGKTFPFSKYTTKISSPRLPVWDTTTIMYITLKTGQVSRHIIYVGN